MKKHMLRMISVLLSLCLLAGLCTPAFAWPLAGDYYTTLPTVYLQGQGSYLYADKDDPNSGLIHSVDVPDGYIGDEAKKLIKPLAKGLLTDDWSDWVDQFVESATPLFEKQALDVNGEASDGSGINGLAHTGGNKVEADGTYSLGAYTPDYDWRLDPFTIADQLYDYLGRLTQRTHKEAVNLVGRSIGASVLMAYLQRYGTEYLETVVLYCPSFFGMEAVSKAFAGKINVSPEGAADFMRYFIDSGMAEEYVGEEDIDTLRTLADFVSTMVALHALDLPAATMDRIYGKVYTEVYPRLMVKMYGSMPSFWSLVGDDDYEEAKAKIFNGQEDVYAGLIQKIDNYHYNVMNKTADILNGLIADGAKIQIIAKYGVPMIPVVEGARVESDMLTSVYSASYKATAADYGTTLTADYISKAEERGAGKYISPDKKIDASTCLQPDHTWFVRDVAHRSMPAGINALLVALVNYEGYMTVFDDAVYPQYLAYDADTDSISPVEPEAVAPTGFRAILARIKDFFTHLFNLIVRLLAG